MDACAVPGLTPVDDALTQLLAAITPLQTHEEIPLDQALGRVLAAPVTSALNIPPADNSAMDGYAMKADDALAGKVLTQVGTVFAGHPFTGVVQAGQCVRIMTGAPLPSSVDTVIMQENTQQADDQITLLQDAKIGSCVRRAGEDIQQGQTVLHTGRRLRAADIGLLASVGCARVLVYSQVTVALLSTGDELKAVGEPLADGQFYESNGPTLKAALQRMGVQVLDYGIVPDDIEKLTRAFNDANEKADVVITSGGVSVGDADYTKDVLNTLGKIQFWKLAIKPGKPFAFGQLGKSYFIGLPGNPVSALVTLHQLARPMLVKLSGAQAEAPLRLTATATAPLKKSPGRTDFQRGIYQINQQGLLEVSATGAQGSGILSSISAANCYIVLEQMRGAVAAGETVTIEPFDEVLR